MYVEFDNYYSPIYQGIRPHFIVWYRAPNFAVLSCVSQLKKHRSMLHDWL